MDLDSYPKKVPIDYKTTDWQMDPKGYFLIDIDRKNQIILVAHHKADGSKNAIFQGSDPIALYYTILKNDTVSLLTHAAYLGQELEKAFMAIKHNLKFVQDDILTMTTSGEDIHTRTEPKKVFHSKDEFQKKKKEEYGADHGGQYH